MVCYGRLVRFADTSIPAERLTNETLRFIVFWCLDKPWGNVQLDLLCRSSRRIARWAYHLRLGVREFAHLDDQLAGAPVALHDLHISS